MTKKTKRKRTASKKKSAKKSVKKEKAELKSSIFQNLKPWHVIVVLIVILLLYLITGNQSAETEDQAGTGESVPVEFYVMSQCPFGTQVIDAIAPVMEKMGDAVDLKIEYIVQEISPGQFSSLHGEPEVQGNIVQLCAKQYNPDLYIKFIVCQNKNAGAIPGNWESCVDSEGLDKESIKTCYEGDEGKELLSESAKRTNKAGARASPTIFINGESYQGARDTLAFQRAICQKTDHPECADIPACASSIDCTADEGKVAVCINPDKKDARCEQQDPVDFELIILNDKTCKEEN
ncbi:thioredoxin domain-containing protein [Thermoproteota archaeon]